MGAIDYDGKAKALFSTLGGLLFGLVGCGSSGEASSDAGASTDGTALLDVLEAGSSDTSPQCVPTACVPSNPCDLGTTGCGSAACTDTGSPAPDGTTCPTGSCTRGICGANVTASQGATNLTTTPLTPGRTCGEGVSYSVVGLTSTTATLAAAPASGCIAPGDEVVLINLQGTTTSTTNIGVFDDLHVLSVSGANITFTTPKTNHYGDGATDDTDIGTAGSQQKVALIRVPVFGTLLVPSGATLTANAWNGLLGGVVALRANTVTVNGTISSAGLGYADGMWSEDGACSTSLQTTAGESITGPGGATLANNAGGSGGLGAGAASFYADTPLSSSAGHANAGLDGGNGQDRAIGQPGVAYGIGDGSRLTLGSGCGGNVTCNTNEPLQLIAVSPTAGGIIAIFGGSITVSGTGSIDSSAASSAIPVARTASAGGYVMLRGDTLDLGSALVLAKGAATGPQGPGNIINTGSDGWIALYYKTSIQGTTAPPARVQQTNSP